jgi:hypothetical protein
MSKTKKMPFGVGFGRIPGDDQEQVKTEIMDENGWVSSQLFSMKKNGTRGLTKSEKSSVKKIISRYSINAFTGEKL